ncbi:hypothetical protein OV450_6613 [Actinobacteria bacterium OV450]|nr:hypothetical protein OV450_6613 [Actinobacteria bacterium OV450]
MSAKLIVYPPDEQGWRRVRYDGVAIGVAHRPADIRVFLAAAGMENATTWTSPTPTSWSGEAPAPKPGSLPLILGGGLHRRGGWRVVCTVVLGGGPKV